MLAGWWAVGEKVVPVPLRRSKPGARSGGGEESSQRNSSAPTVTKAPNISTRRANIMSLSLLSEAGGNDWTPDSARFLLSSDALQDNFETTNTDDSAQCVTGAGTVVSRPVILVFNAQFILCLRCFADYIQIFETNSF
jgi:hypothetical protein